MRATAARCRPCRRDWEPIPPRARQVSLTPALPLDPLVGSEEDATTVSVQQISASHAPTHAAHMRAAAETRTSPLIAHQPPSLARHQGSRQPRNVRQ
jgi:hypothetical protein